MNLLDKKQYQAILINSVGNSERFKFLVDNNTFKNYAGDPVGKVVKLKVTVDVLETFLSVVNHDNREFATEVKEELAELLRAYKSDLDKARDKKEYHKNYYKKHKEQKGE